MFFKRRHYRNRYARGVIPIVWVPVVLLFCAAVRPVRGTPASQPASVPAAASRPSDDEIRSTVRLLNHPSPGRRRAAIRKLAEWGPLAFAELRRAAKGKNHEAALAARELLEELEPAILLGARVRLETSRAHVAWDEPFDLILHVENPTDAEIRVPWPAPTTQPAHREAVQVAAMMDTADFLEVADAEDEPIELRVDPIEQDADVYAAVNARAGHSPPSHVLPAGTPARLVVPAFNRGWARFPMFEAQTYTIQFHYQPEWKDHTWVQDGFGRVTSEPIQVTVTQSAPKRIRQARTPVTLHLAQEGDLLEIRIESNWDRTQWINANLGADLQRHAVLNWRWDQGIFSEKHRLALALIDEIPPLDLKHVRALKPGETIVVKHVAWSKLRKRLEPALPPNVGMYGLSARYVNVLTARDIRNRIERDKASDDGDHVPAPVFTGTAESNSLRMSRGADTRPE